MDLKHPIPVDIPGVPDGELGLDLSLRVVGFIEALDGELVVRRDRVGGEVDFLD